MCNEANSALRPQNIWRHCTKFSCQCDLATEVCALQSGNWTPSINLTAESGQIDSEFHNAYSITCTHALVRTALFWVIMQNHALKMGPIGWPETSVRNYHYSLCNNPEERSSNLLRGGRLKSSYWWLKIGLLLLFCIIVLPRTGEQKTDTWKRQKEREREKSHLFVWIFHSRILIKADSNGGVHAKCSRKNLILFYGMVTMVYYIQHHSLDGLYHTVFRFAILNTLR
jgi:hypothetical protein